jgi:PEP-CTERM motif
MSRRVVSCGILFIAIAAQSFGTTWVNWTALTTGTPGSATGTLGAITISYSGELINGVINGTSGIWSPNSSFIGGTVDTSPSAVNDDLRLIGTSAGNRTITFSSAVVNPVFAIWSLGAPTVPASFTFLGSAVPTLQAGGPNSQFGGSSITVSGQVVNGAEGNGVVQFTGAFTSISWTSTPENFYAFTVGLNGASTVPEPATVALTVAGLGLLGVAARRKTGR